MMLRVSESEPSIPAAACAADEALAFIPSPVLQRTSGYGAILVDRDANGGQRLVRLRQAGGAKILCPRNHQDAAFEAVLLNTAGGLAGDDHLCWNVTAGRGAVMRVTTQTAERVYRSNGGDALVETRLQAGPGAALEWLPQETILFDRAKLSRTLSIDLAEDAGLLAVEAVVLGRRAFGERVRSGSLRDHWRVRRGGRLIHADSVRIDGDIAALLDRPGTLGGAQAFATLLLAGAAQIPIDDLRAMLPAGEGLDAAASALPHVTLVRMIAAHGDILRPALAGLLHALRGAALPRVWQA
jgi:urease accessory protein